MKTGDKVRDSKGRVGIVEALDKFPVSFMARLVYVRWLKKDGTVGKLAHWCEVPDLEPAE